MPGQPASRGPRCLHLGRANPCAPPFPPTTAPKGRFGPPPLHHPTCERQTPRLPAPPSLPTGKVVDRHWYERNKHIFPASRWETYDPEKVWDTYTTHGREVN